VTRYGWTPPTRDSRDHSFTAPRPYTGQYVDLSANFPEAPYDQGALGSCVPNGTAAAVDFARVKQGLAPLDRPSRLFIYWNGRREGGFPIDQDTGLQVRDGLKVVGKYGAPPESAWPYDIARFTQQPSQAAYTKAKDDVAVSYGQVAQGTVDDAIASGYPVVFGFNVPESFESDAVATTGVMPVPRSAEARVGGHCTVAVSTVRDGADIPNGVAGRAYRKVRNSWGVAWGDQGYFWMPASFMDGPEASDFWTVTRVNDPNVNPPGDVDRTFADVLRPWVAKRHVGSNHTVALAAQAWLKARSL
jgi:hypothetical protein